MKVSIICTENTYVNIGCIPSLLNQTLKDIEIILPYHLPYSDSRVTYGVKPSGQYLMQTDMRCVFSPNMLAVMTAGMDTSGADIGICGRIENSVKSAVISTMAETDDKKLALIQRLITKGLLFTQNNTVIRNNNHDNFIDTCTQYAKNSTIQCFSNAFVIGEGGVIPKQQILDILAHFLSQGGRYDKHNNAHI